MGRSRKACPVCKETHILGYDTEKGCCAACLKLLEKGREYEAQLTRKDAPSKLYRCNPHGASIGYFPYCNQQVNKDLDTLKTRLHSLLSMTSEIKLGWLTYEQSDIIRDNPTEDITGTSSGSNFRSDYGCVKVTPEFADAMREIYQLLNRVLPAIYESGKQSGSNLLLQLASGELTVDQFNEKSSKSR